LKAFLRHDAAGEPDDIYVEAPQSIHIERMRNDAWWIGITRDGQELHLWLTTPDEAGAIGCNVADDGIGCVDDSAE
jgi:hypothetical protein